MNTIKAVLFDVNGVLVQTTDQSDNYLWSANIDKDLNISDKDLQHIMTSMNEDVLFGRITLLQSLENIIKVHKINIDAHILMQYYLDHNMHLNFEILYLLQCIKIKKYILTYNEPMYMARLNHKIGYYFDGYFASYETQCHSIINTMQYIESLLGLKPCEILYVDNEDHNKQDIINRGSHYIQYNINNGNDIDTFKQHLQLHGMIPE